jgi:hypothetical protein
MAGLNPWRMMRAMVEQVHGGNGNLLDMIERISHMEAEYGLEKISLQESEGMWRSAA